MVVMILIHDGDDDMISYDADDEVDFLMVFQVRFVYSVMKRERPGMTVLQLYGRLNQLRRIDIYRDFCRKQHVILFATDIACRGLGECCPVCPCQCCI